MCCMWELVREVPGSVPGGVIPNTLEMVVIAGLLGAPGRRVSIMSGVRLNGPVVLVTHQGIAVV